MINLEFSFTLLGWNFMGLEAEVRHKINATFGSLCNTNLCQQTHRRPGTYLCQLKHVVSLHFSVYSHQKQLWRKCHNVCGTVDLVLDFEDSDLIASLQATDKSHLQ